jgi:type IV pilus assembly protein PilW
MIELLISVAIGLVVVGAVTYMYVGSKGTYRGSEALARMQDAARFALDSMARDIRRAGALGCGSTASVAGGQGTAVKVNVIPSAAGLAVDANGQPIAIQGFEPAASAYQPLPATSPTGWTAPTGPNYPTYWGGDVLQLQIASGTPVRVTAENIPNGTVTIADNRVSGSTRANFSNNNFAVLANCSTAAVFQVSGTPAAAASAVMSYASAAVPLTVPGQFSLATDTYPTLQHYDQVTYFVGQVPHSVSVTNPNGVSALYRYSLSSNQPPEELVDNVEDMDVVYGVGTNGTITSYKKPNTPMLPADFLNVLSVRVSLVVVGDQQNFTSAAQTLMFHGSDAAPLTLVAQAAATDGRLRQVFNATTALRDRLQ